MMSRKRIAVGSALLAMVGGLGYAIRAGASSIPSTGALTYAGVLEDPTGPVNGTRSIQVSFYDTAGTVLCSSPAGAAIEITDGHFSVPLDVCPPRIATNPDVWIDVLVDGSDRGRTKIDAVPHAVGANQR